MSAASPWRQAREREAAKLAGAVTAAARAGDRRGVAELLGRAEDREAAAGIVTAAVAIADEPLREYRALCERWRAERLALRQREADRLIGEAVRVLAEAMGVTAADIERGRRASVTRRKDNRDEGTAGSA